MEFAVIRNNRQRDLLLASLKDRRLPFKVAVQDIYPVRSVDFNDYYWGFLITPIAEFTGHSPDEVHEECKKRFNLVADFKWSDDHKRWEIIIETGSTTELNSKQMWEYAARIRAEAEIDLGLTLALPNETFVNELNFEKEL